MLTGKNCDYWLILNENPGVVFAQYGADSLKVFAYHIDNNGICQQPVISYVKSFHSDGLKIKQAPDQSYLIIMGRFGSTEGEVATFDYNTGHLKSLFSLPYGYLGSYLYYYKGIVVPFPFNDVMYDLEFSSNSKKVYVVEHKQSWTFYDPIITQLDFSELDSTKVMASKRTLDTLESIVYLRNIRRVDDTIFTYGVQRNDIDYMLHSNTDSARYIRQHLSFNDTIIEDYQLLCWTSVRFATGSSIQSLTKLICKKGEEHFVPSIALSQLEDPKAGLQFEWSDGFDQLQRPLDTGTYVLRYTYFSGTCRMSVTDSFNIGLDALEKPIVQVNKRELSCMQDYSNYQWYRDGQLIAGATEKKLQVTENGYYKVAVNNEGYCSDTSESYPVTNVAGIGDPEGEHSIYIYPNPARDYIRIKSPKLLTAVIKSVDGRELFRLKGASLISLFGWTPGIYLLQLMDEYGTILKNEKLVKY